VTSYLNFFKKNREEKEGSKQDLQNRKADKVHVPVALNRISFNLMLGI